MKFVVIGSDGSRADHLDLRPVAGEQLVAREPVEVEQLGRVAERRRGPRRHDLLERVVPLRPERRAPRPIELVDRAVLRREPLAERGRRHVAVAAAHVASVLVVHVPQLERRMLGVPLHQSRDELPRPLAVHGRARAVLLATADRQSHAVLGHGQRLGMPHREPWRRRRGGRGEVDADPVRVQEVEHLVEPGEVVLARTRLEARPREDADRGEVDAAAPHEPHVLVPHLPRPLLGVVVAAVPDRHDRPFPFGGHGSLIPSRRRWRAPTASTAAGTGTR